MSDPYGHGETCDCTACESWSAGYQAAKDEVPPAPLPAPLNKITAHLDNFAQILPPSGAAYVLGLIHGRCPPALALQHVAAIDALCRMGGKKKDIVTYLITNGLALPCRLRQRARPK